MNKRNATLSTGVGESGATKPANSHQSPLPCAMISRFKAEHVHHSNEYSGHLTQ